MDLYKRVSAGANSKIQFLGIKSHFLLLAAAVFCFACDRNTSEADSSAEMSVQFKFDPAQQRLNNLGQAADLPLGHAAQTPDFRDLAIHYLELSNDVFTPLGQGAVLFKGPELMIDGEKAIDHSKIIRAPTDSIFARYAIKNIPPGTYNWVRVSVAAQRFDFKFNINNLPVVGNLIQQNGTVASILGFNNYLTSVQPRLLSVPVNDAVKQGFWALETNLSAPYNTYNNIYSGQAPAGATTVVNPLFATSPVPSGSCVVTGKLFEPLIITGQETEDLSLILAFSINKSLEWIDSTPNGQLDLDASTATFEQITDMGLRGLKPYVKN